MLRKKIDLICAARPNFMKVAPLWHELEKAPWAAVRLVHTGQHYDENMSGAFFSDLGLPEPHVHLEVGSGSHAEQVGNTMIAYEREVLKDRPDLILVVGDVNATAACSQVGAKLHIPVAHLEAGLRSFDRRMPEEINRLVTDALADLLLTPSPDADENLRKEGIPEEKIVRVGNIMIDSLERMREEIEGLGIQDTFGVTGGEYALCTLHRPSNVDAKETFEPIVEALLRCGKELPILFPLHPRTRKKLEEFSLYSRIHEAEGVKLLPPLPYKQFMGLLFGARALVTDSGGVQEETTYLGIPCLTLRENTERPVTIEMGTNQLLGAPELYEAYCKAVESRERKPCTVPLWDGKTAERASRALGRFWGLS